MQKTTKTAATARAAVTTKEQTLERMPLFAGLDRDQRRRVAGLLTEVDIRPGRVLIREGAPGHEFFVIVRGSATIDVGGSRIAEVGPGDFSGELSLLDGGLRTATVTATTPMRILVASRPEFQAILAAAPDMARAMLAEVGHRVRALQRAD